jgi:tetratricopeptide (TPR) repeat protein
MKQFILAVCLLGSSAALAQQSSVSQPAAQQPAAPPDVKDFKLDIPALTLPLEPAQQAAFDAAMKQRAFTEAETILVNAAQREYARDKQSKIAAQLYEAVGGVFFINGEFLNAAISFKRADAAVPLQARNRFTLAMSYLRMNRRDWAKPELERLVKERPANALYLYWLGRLDYDAKAYNEAIAKLTKVVELDPTMMRAYDNLGLCYDYLGKYDEAVKHYRRAIELNTKQTPPSAWPHLNLAITLLAQNQVIEAETQLREAIRHNAQVPQAHYQLGLALEKLNKPAAAIAALEEAARLDANYAEPHYTLGQLYKKQGDNVKAQAALAKFQSLKSAQKK